MPKKKRKYTKKDKTISHATTPLTGRQYVSSGYTASSMNSFASDTDTIIEDDYFSEESEAAARESLEKEINRYHESDSTEVKAEEKRGCYGCAEIDKKLKILYFNFGFMSIGLISLFFAHKNGRLKPISVGFYCGCFFVILVWTATLIFNYRTLRKKFESE